MGILLGMGCIEAIYGLIGLKGLINIYHNIYMSKQITDFIVIH